MKFSILIIYILFISCLNAVEQKVVSSLLNVKSMIEQHNKTNVIEAHVKKFEGETLAYVTPWNNRGYDIVKEFKGKFDYVSPVWYYIQRRSTMKYDIDGEHDVDQSWMKEVKSESKGKILPRFQLRNWSGDDLRAFISNEQEAEELALQINKQVEKYAFDGVVMECGFPTFFQAFLIKLSQLLHQQNRQLIVVLPAILIEEHKRLINDKLFDMMLNYVDRFSLMTYDYSSHIPNGGPAAPIEWIMDNIEYLTNSENRHKLLIGLNMYAMSYSPTRSPEPLVMKTIIEKLSNDNRAYEEFNWDKESQEAWFIDIDKENGDRLGTIWLPTLRSIRNRLRLAKDYGVGVALWEVGQGLDYFFDLF